MENAFHVLFFELALLGLSLGLGWLLLIRPLAKDRARRRDPFTRELQRAPGESLLDRLWQIDEKIGDALVVVAVTLGFFMGLVSRPMLKISQPMVVVVGVCAFTAVVLFTITRLRPLLRERRNSRLGLRGERDTAQALLPLLGAGYAIYHDVPFKDSNGKAFNIDHVAVGATGVFVIETKARRKSAEAKGSATAKVRYDGKMLTFPGFQDSWGLDQARANARFLARELSRHTGESVQVGAILSLPGWFVEQTAPNVDPIVLNPLQIPGWISARPTAGIAPAQLARIRGFLEKAAGADSNHA
jgi:hypothetical protein